MNRIVSILLILLCTQCTLHAQNGSLSGTKIAALSHSSLPKGLLEFEPTFSSSWYSSYFTDSGTEEYGSKTYESGLSWRITTGIFDKAEIGVNASSTFESIDLGFKYTLRDSARINLAAMLGYSSDLGNRTYVPPQSRYYAYQLGLISTIILDDKNSIDFNVQLEQSYANSNDWSTWYLNADFGTYALHKDYLLILGASYFISSDGHKKFSLIPALSIEGNEQFFLVVALTDDIWGRNQVDNTTGFSLTVTIELN